MDAWQLWQEMAAESERAARNAAQDHCLRSSVSRYYYAAYQATTALLLYRKLTPPVNREAWSHDMTPIILREQLETLIASRDQRRNLASRLERLYKTRISADYMGSEMIDALKLNFARKDAGYILKTIFDILPER